MSSKPITIDKALVRPQLSDLNQRASAKRGAIQKSDFRGVPAANQKAFKEELLGSAANSASTQFNAPTNPLRKFPLKGNTVYCLVSAADKLVERQLCINIKDSSRLTTLGRTSIVENLRLLIEEGFPLFVYRLDVRKFYESFEKGSVLEAINQLGKLSPQSKALVNVLLDSHQSIGGNGIPRGLPISAILSDLMMRDFDRRVFEMPEVFYFARYVDDIIIVTSAREKTLSQLQDIKSLLPIGLQLNPAKFSIVGSVNKVKPQPAGSPKAQVLGFDYLGYKFTASEPYKNAPDKSRRVVEVDIAAKKVKKYKTRIARALLDFALVADWGLLLDRIKFLTSNFSVYNANIGKKKLAGIHFSYPIVDPNAASLVNLDSYLRDLVFAKSCRLSSKIGSPLSARQKRELLSHSFVRGHKDRPFVHFSASRISQIQSCWIN